MAKCVLIVDDAASIRGLVGMTLRNSGYEVVEAADGREALNRLSENRVNMVVSDLNMPNMDGIELLKAMKASPALKFTPFVMLTTEGADEKKREGQAAGAKAWMVKPFKPDTLVKVVKKIIG
ncbi:MAG: response regulator [Deltaproteobacteria bacterium]|nr:response regulator [Deltaproteobacteria bacterium]